MDKEQERLTELFLDDKRAFQNAREAREALKKANQKFLEGVKKSEVETVKNLICQILTTYNSPDIVRHLEVVVEFAVGSWLIKKSLELRNALSQAQKSGESKGSIEGNEILSQIIERLGTLEKG